MSLNSVMKKIESEALKACEDIKSSGVCETKNTGEIGEKLINIMNTGNKEFEKAAGRPMTYSEMRQMFG